MNHTKPFSHILADNNYSTFHYVDGTKEIFATTIKKLEHLGIRIHQSVIINPECMRQILNYDTFYQVQMNDQSIHRVAKRREKYFLEQIEILTQALKEATQRLND